MHALKHQTMLQLQVLTSAYNGIAHSDINGTYTSISNVTLDSYDITSPSSSNATPTVMLAVLL